MVKSRRSIPMVLQTESAECGLACIAMIAGHYGQHWDLHVLRERFSSSARGTTLSRLVDIVRALGFTSRPLRADIVHLKHMAAPFIAHWDFDHYVVITAVTKREVVIHDPARGVVTMPLAEVSEHFTGVLLEVKPGADFVEVKKQGRFSLRSVTGTTIGLRRALVQVFGLALVIELFGLLLPFQLQWTVDQIVLSADKNLLVVLTVAFTLVLLIRSALAFARGWVIGWLGATLNAEWINNLFFHLLKIRLDYFQKRHIGDIVSRFGSVKTVQTTLTGRFLEAVVDGIMGLLALVVLSLYSGALTSMVVMATALYGLLRAAMQRRLWLINEEQLFYSARQQSELMESIRGIQAIKLGNKQAERHVRLANETFNLAERDMQNQRMVLGFGAVSQACFGLMRILIVSAGASFVMRGNFTVGMLVAFVAYADQFSQKMISLIDKVVDLRMLKLHLQRIADIAITDVEPDREGTYAGEEPTADISLVDIGFRYSEGEPWVFRHVNLTIASGETVAITGPSGSGKSTLAKLILGLIEPKEGSVRIGGVDIRKYGLDRFRQEAGAVMQDDHLFAGTIAENISFFDAMPDQAQVVAAAKLASVHEDIACMPMGYQSLVGDMGSTLSGGQKQRIILARAFYKRPRVLVLDEATSHLDASREMSVNRGLKTLRSTNVVIAHREETIASADRVVDLASLVRDTAIGRSTRGGVERGRQNLDDKPVEGP